MKCKRDLSKNKKKIKTMNSKMATNNYQQLNLKNKRKYKNKLSKQLKQEQNHRN